MDESNQHFIVECTQHYQHPPPIPSLIVANSKLYRSWGAWTKRKKESKSEVMQDKTEWREVSVTFTHRSLSVIWTMRVAHILQLGWTHYTHIIPTATGLFLQKVMQLSYAPGFLLSIGTGMKNRKLGMACHLTCDKKLHFQPSASFCW